MKNAINWFSIPVSNYDRAKVFYEEILKVKLIDVQMGPNKMAFFPVENGGIGGSLNLKETGFAPLDNDTIPIYLASDNLQESLDSVDKANGKVLMNKTLISPEFGYFGLIMDTEGNKIGLHSNS